MTSEKTNAEDSAAPHCYADDIRVTALLPRYAVSVSDAHPNHYGNMVPVGHCQKLLNRALAIINDAILHGMPVTGEVAEVSNLIRGTSTVSRCE